MVEVFKKTVQQTNDGVLDAPIQTEAYFFWMGSWEYGMKAELSSTQQCGKILYDNVYFVKRKASRKNGKVIQIKPELALTRLIVDANLAEFA